ncbi:SubName: Full=Uncharacterized protein {ECO:0000313/EMBL:CCA72196.1} [Serendipita indica DSM 11827]|nr:SubName: Full=Uncharacterized protein {ECO:0000313/EMBL:CCA72196.1} [Serendipita indica DSM 11827]
MESVRRVGTCAGPVVSQGLAYKPNAPATERILFLSDHLDASELVCAALVNAVASKRPNLPGMTHIELATREYYAIRDGILNVWHDLLTMLVAAHHNEVESGSLVWRLAEQTVQILHGREEGATNSFVMVLLEQLDGLAQRMEVVRKKLVDATSQTSTSTSLRDVVLEGELEKVGEQLVGPDILHLLQWTSKFDAADDLGIHVTAAALYALSSSPPTTDAALSNLSDVDYIKSLLTRFDKGTDWKSKGVKSALQLQCSLFLVACRAKDPTACDEQNATVDAVETMATDAMESDAFIFLDQIVAATAIPTASKGADLVDEDVRPKVYAAVESVVIGLLVSLPNVLKRLKHRQEDIGLSARKHQPTPFVTALGRTIVEPAPVAPAPTPRTDIASLFKLIGTIYDALPAESALKFWTVQNVGKNRQADIVNARLPSFLRWAAESRGEVMVPAVYDMLAGLAKGTACSEHAYNFLSTGGVSTSALAGMQVSYGGGAFSWSVLFGSLGYYADALPNPRTIQQHRQQGPLPEMRVEEASLLVSFLKLLRVVVHWSVPARLALADHPQYRAVPAMLQLATCRVPLELKGAIYEAVGAFCAPGGGVAGAAICRNTWLMLEQLQVLDTLNVAVGVGATHGIKFELLEVEVPSKVYPCTPAFIRLMNSLIHTSKDLSLRQVLFGADGGKTIPDGLGLPHRQLPLAPYLSFAADDVLFLAEDAFKTDADRWSLKDLCLQFVEKSLASFDLESIPAALQAIATQGPQVIKPYVLHPGFDVMTRLLTDTRLRAVISDFLAEGPNKMEKGTIKTTFFESCMRRVVRIVHRVLDVQSFFLDMLVPAIQSFDFSPILNDFAPGQLIALDRHLLFNHVLVERIALLVTMPSPEIQLLCIRILGLLALSPNFTIMDQQASRMARRLNRLAVIVQNSDDSVRINDGFAALLATPSVETDEADDLEMHIGAGAPALEEGAEEVSLTHIIRLEIMDLLLKNSEKGRPAPNLAHLLLGFDVATASTNEMSIQDPNALNSNVSCFHVVTDLLREGIPSLDSTQKRRHDAALGATPLYFKAPLLAEKCHRLFYQLCSHELTSKPSARYLRTREDYFARNLAALPIRAPEILTQPEGMASYADGTSIDTTCRALSSFLRMRSWLLESIALELHLLTDERQFPKAGRLLDILFGSVDTMIADTSIDDLEDQFFGNAVQVFAPGQSLMLLRLGVARLGRAPKRSQLYFYASLDYSSCLQTAESGAEIIDRDALIGLLSTIRRMREETGHLTPEAEEQLSQETKYLLESCVKENNRREIEHAKSMGFEAWRRVVNISLAKCFNRLPIDGREGILFDLLQEVPPVIRQPSLAVSSAILLSEVTVMLITKLREDRSQRIQMQALTDDSNFAATSLPEDRFHGILKSLIESLLTSGMPEVVRGNLYASVTNHLQLVQTVANVRRMHSVVDDEHEEEPLFGSSKAFQSYTALEIGCVNIINSLSERLIPVLCRDAIDGSEVWKTVAFTLLDSLIRLSRIQRQHRVLHLLSRGGYLGNFCVGFKEADEELQGTLVPEPSSLNALFVHEAKTAFLIRIAQTRAGAERLLAARLLSVLAQCDYIDARPDATQTFQDTDSLFSPSLERWHQLVKPTLQLVASVLATLGSSNGEAYKQAMEFVLNHRETLRALLMESGRLSLAHLSELSLVVAISSYVVPRVDRNDLTTRSSGFGPLHEVILTLASKTIYTGRWGAVVAPANDAELAESRNAPAAFQARILEATEDLQRAVFNYLVASSDASGPTLYPQLSTSLFVPRDGDVNPQQAGPVPSVGDAIVALREVYSYLNRSLLEVNSYSVKLLNQDSSGMDELEEARAYTGIALASLEGSELLEPSQKRALAFGHLQEMMNQRIKDSNHYMDSLEELLLLVWRHVDYYINYRSTPAIDGPTEPAPKANELGLSQTARPTPTPPPETRSGWGMSLFSPFRRRADSPAPGTGGTATSPAPLGASVALANGTGRSQLGRSMLTVSALGGRAPTLRSTEDSQAEAFRVDVARVLEPLLDRLDELQLPDDIASLDFRIRGPYVQSFIKRLRAVIKAPTSEETEE